MNELQNYGVLAAVLFLLGKEALALLAKRKNGNGGSAADAGRQTIDFWKEQNRIIIKDILAPFLSSQTEIFRDLRDGQKEANDAIKKLVWCAEQERNDRLKNV